MFIDPNNPVNPNNMMQSANINKFGIYVKSFRVIETRKKYEDVYKRTHNLNMNHNKLHHLEQFLGTRQTRLGNSISNLDLASAIPDIVNINAIPIGEAGIVNGWGTPRLRFLLVIEQPLSAEIIKEYYIQGYSEYLDPSALGSIDPNMMFYINSIVNVNRYIDPIHRIPTVTIESTVNVITNSVNGSTNYQEVMEPTTMKLMRPMDIFNAVSNVENNGGSIILDNSADVGNDGKASSRANNDGLNYFVDIANKFISNRVISSVGHDTRDIFKNCITESAEPALVKNGFLAALSTVTGVVPPISFNLNQLDAINPNYTPDYFRDDKHNLIGGYNVFDPNATIMDSDVTETMHQATVEIQTATKISQVLTAYMAQNHIGRMTTMFHNLAGVPVVTVACSMLVDGVSDEFIMMKTNIVKNNIEKILLREISMNNNILLDCNVVADMFGDTTVALNMRLGHGGNNLRLYRFPTFADSLYPPVVGDTTSRGVMVEDFTNVLEAINSF